jgi:hypothetical protein
MINFRMNLEDKLSVRVSRTMLMAPRSSEVIRARFGASQDTARGLDIPSNNDLLLLYEELERGASGDHSHIPINNDL